MFNVSLYREWVLYAGYGLIGLATFLLMRMLLTEQENMSTQENIRDLEGKKTANPLVRITRPFFSQYIMPAIRGKARFDKMRVKYRRKLISGGLKDQLTADEFISFKTFQLSWQPFSINKLYLSREPLSTEVFLFLNILWS